ncbi:MAG: hypothetical protein QNL33_03455 [Akkermansiaceae bacterium]
MNVRLSHCALVSGCLCGLALALTVLFDRTATRGLEILLRPWFSLCEMLTPDSWQSTGHVIPGMLWLLSGVAVYSICLGTMCVLIRATLKRRARSVG